jgi:hypothetical protein
MIAQPPLNLTQKLGSLMMQIQSFLVIIKSVINDSIVKFVQVSSFVGLHNNERLVYEYDFR